MAYHSNTPQALEGGYVPYRKNTLQHTHLYVSSFFDVILEDMKAYMKQAPPIYFEFSWTVFFLNFTVSLLLGLVIAAATGKQRKVM